MARVALCKITGPPGAARIDLPVSGPRAPPIALTGCPGGHRALRRGNYSPGTVGQNTLTRNRNNRRTGGLSGRSLPGPGAGMQELAYPAAPAAPGGRIRPRPGVRVYWPP